MAVSLTPAAVAHVARLLTDRGKGLGLRLETQSRNHSGFTCVVSYADDIGCDDHVFENSGLKVVVDAHSLGLVDGTEIDYIPGNPSNAGFDLHYPAASGRDVHDEMRIH